MMNRALVNQVRQRGRGRCEYCRMPSAYDPLPFQVDHVIAEQHGGETVLENLVWSYLHCNKHKGPNIAGLDPLTGRLVPQFHPRRQRWDRHFAWDGPMLVGRTRIGRTTVRVLAMNDPDFVAFRARLMDEETYEPG